MLCLAAACSSSQGLRVESLNEMLDQEAARFREEPPAKMDQPSARKQDPPVLGLFVKPTGFLQREFEWTDQDRDQVLTWAKQLAARGLFTGAMFVPQSSLKGGNAVELRATAARYGAGLLLILDGTAVVDRYNNYKAPLLYWTILGAYLVDGTHSDALCLVKASLLDVKTGAVLFEEKAEGLTRKVGPAAFVDDREEVKRARQLALGKLLRQVTERLEPAAGVGR